MIPNDDKAIDIKFFFSLSTLFDFHSVFLGEEKKGIKAYFFF